ncbi:MAG: hypothetical protein A2Y76_01420 [Planctomycetes bacterium RBG_13_60_9]|nr:MAG: hypothetical protein A2Y76_01420 [Planctomycetes bacterium RBG_13_60_9]
MAGKWVMFTTVMMLSAPVIGAIGDTGAPGLLIAADAAPALNVQNQADALSQAQQAISAAVGIPEQIRERLLGQVGPQIGGDEQPDPGPAHTSVGLDLASLMTAHANTVGHRPEFVAGLENAAAHISEQAREALRLTPIRWIADQLAN